MALISLQEVELGFGGPLLLDRVNLQIEKGDRVGLLGRNGMGKTSLMKVILGELEPDGGSVARQQNLRMAYLPQEVPGELGGRVGEIVASGLDGHEKDEEESWKHQLQVEKTLSRMELDPQAAFEKLSAGMKRRVLLARGLVSDPQLLLLDEPTNHLDIRTIDWLEDFLLRWGGTLLFVVHDRMFLQRTANRIIELDRGRLIDWNCDYPTFVVRKEGLLSAEQEQNILFDKKLAQEEAWIRRGIEARRTRNEGRVRALKRLRELRQERREQPGKARLQIQEARRSGKLVIEAEAVSFAYGDKPVVKGFSTSIQRGEKIGIIGPNGSGKTSLLRLLMGELEPQEGEIRFGTNLEAAYFDQLRARLDENKTVLENIAESGDSLTINGKPRNVVGYLESFLFPAERVTTTVSLLSGGERNRLLLAKLFARPANLLVLDEPTNDLDIETLEVLETNLLEFNGTVLFVSHDRALLENLATSILEMDGSGAVREYLGGYEDWKRQSEARATAANEREAAVKPAAAGEAGRKPGYKEKRLLEAQKKELAELPQRIEALEAEQKQLAVEMAKPAFYQQDSAAISAAAERVKEIEAELEQAYQRWEELEEMVGS
jgi:ABC transport system ATP-binding/permease protein